MPSRSIHCHELAGVPAAQESSAVVYRRLVAMSASWSDRTLGSIGIEIMKVTRILLLVIAASFATTAVALAQVPADLRAAMQARDTAFYAADSAQWEKYTAASF